MSQLQLTISLVLFNESPDDISGLISDINDIKLNKKLYILDNSPEKINTETFKDELTEVIRSSTNLGYGKGHNVCIKKAIADKSSCHLIVNPDIRFNGNDISKLYDYVVDSPDVGVVIPSVYYKDGSFQYIYKLLPDPLTLFSRYGAKIMPNSLVERLNYNYELRFKDYNKPFELPVISGCFMFCRTKALEEVGGFDDRFFMYMEDVDLSRRISKSYKNMYYPYVKIQHGFNKLSYKSLRLMKAHILSAVKYFNKWGWFFDSDRSKINKEVTKKD